jgi:two-component system CheB/CheR fusion protein
MAGDEGTGRTTGESAARFVVAIGASAGALEALRTLLGGLRANTGAAFIVVAHRSTRRVSSFVELLRPYTELGIREAGAATPLEPDVVAVVPATAGIAAIDTHLRLAPAASIEARRGRVDAVFRAVAAARGGRSIGIVLTGAGSDGALGLAQIKGRGGLTIVQDPVEAEQDGMPRSAIDGGGVDLVLPLRDIPSAIARYCGTQPRLPIGGDGAGESAALAELLEQLEARTGRAFGAYARGPLERRVGKRMRLHGFEDWPRYVDLVRSDSGEAEALCNELLLNVTEFFGHQPAFERLERSLLPKILEAKSDAHDTLRAWLVGCSTGEDAYSLAIALLEAREQRAVRPAIQLFASDLADEPLRYARLGVYPAEIAETMPSARLTKFFLREDGTYRVRPHLRNLVVFARHDVVSDFPFSNLDLVVCGRTVLENLTPDARLAVLRNFHYGLLPNGVLMVDSAAALDIDAPSLFAPDGQSGVYRRVASAPRLPALSTPAFASAQPHERRAPGSEEKRALPDSRVLHLALLERYTPASVLVDSRGRVVHYSQRAGRYLRVPGGELTHELVRLVREPLRSAVRAGLDAAGRTSETWSSDALLVHADNGVRRVVVHVEPSGPGFPAADVRLVVFEEVGAGDTVRDDQRVVPAADFTLRLGSELDEASRRLKAAVEREQARVATEADAGDNDADLAGALDDLEAAKQELRSIHEELTTLDQDNRQRLEELGRLSADLEVLLESTGLATLFLDHSLNVVRFTSPLLGIFHVVPGDRGKPLAELTHRLRGDELLADAQRVLDHLAPIEREVEADNGKWYLLRMLPYRSAPKGIGGVAITLVDITSRKKAERELLEADRRKDEFIALLAHELRNPLAPISSGIEILKRRDLDPAIAERVTLTMSRQAAQLVRLIDDLLDVSRITSGRLQLRKKLVGLADIVRDAVAAVRPIIDRSGHELTVNMPRERIALDADAARLTQVLANLVNNAARYTPNGGKIEVGVRRDGEEAVVTVTDNGYGIAEDALPHVFEMFYQGADPRSPTQAGLGIGLGLAKSLVDMHGGTITAESAGLDCGSTFTVRLPVQHDVGAEQAATATRVEQALGGHRVLVVDDNADAAQTLATLIRTLGTNDVHVAFSGEEALPIAERVRPDTVFLDLKMPDMDGYEVAERLRREPWCEDTWLVALTGWGLDEHKRRTQRSGFDQHLTKPADRAALEVILSRPPLHARH